MPAPVGAIWGWSTLKNMGIIAGIEKFESTSVEKYPNMETAALDTTRGVEIDDSQYAGLLNIAKNRLKQKDGVYVAVSKMKWVLISWHKSTSLNKMS